MVKDIASSSFAMSSSRKNSSAPSVKHKILTRESSTPPPTDRGFHLKRGKACHTCRRKKLKCDGVRPACGYCQRRSQECEFDDPETWGKQRQLQYQVEDLTTKLEAARRECSSLTQALEEQKTLNQKLKRPVHPVLVVDEPPIVDLTLDNDMPEHNDSQASRSGSQQAEPNFGIEFDSPLSFPSTELSSPLLPLDAMGYSDISFSHGQEHSSGGPSIIPQLDKSAFLDLKLTARSQSILMHASLPHLPQCCLDVFQAQDILSRFEEGGAQALHDALLYAMFAVSCRYATEYNKVSRHESRFRQRAQFALRPRGVLSRAEIFDSVRAAVILALYFNMEDCLKEASTYVAIALGYLLELDQAEEHFDICRVARECTQDERLVFQSAYIADRLIAAQLQSPVIFPEEIKQICCVDQLKNNSKPKTGTQGGMTSQPTTPSFQSRPLSPGVKRSQLDELFLIQLRTECASLTYNASQRIKLDEVCSLLKEAKELRSYLPSIYVKPSSPDKSNVDLTILTMHTQVFAALTKLTRRCFPRNGLCLEMAGEVVALIHELRDEDFVLLDATMGLCWEWCAEAILGETSVLSHRHDLLSMWVVRIQVIIAAMKRLAVYIPICSVNVANTTLQYRVWKVV